MAEEKQCTLCLKLGHRAHECPLNPWRNYADQAAKA